MCVIIVIKYYTHTPPPSPCIRSDCRGEKKKVGKKAILYIFKSGVAKLQLTSRVRFSSCGSCRKSTVRRKTYFFVSRKRYTNCFFFNIITKFFFFFKVFKCKRCSESEFARFLLTVLRNRLTVNNNISLVSANDVL